jgi:hypothetical protein
VATARDDSEALPASLNADFGMLRLARHRRGSGGQFAAMEVQDLLIADVRTFFRLLRWRL